MKSTVSLKYFLTGFLWKTIFGPNSPPDSFKLNSFDNFSNYNVFHIVLT